MLCRLTCRHTEQYGELMRTIAHWYSKTYPILLILIGLSLVGVAFLTDTLGWGSQSGIGKYQLALALVGVTMAVGGTIIYLPLTNEQRLGLLIASISGSASLTAVLYFAVSFFHLPVLARVNVFPDDSFYYMTPALNIAKGLGPTADTVTLTSGFHPLWMGVLVALGLLVQLNKAVFFEGVILLGLFLHVVGAFLIYLVGARFVPRLLAWGWALIYLVSMRGLLDAISGTEAALLALLLVAFLWHETHPDSRSVTCSVQRGFLFGLLFLARTDTIFFIAGYLLIDAWIELFSCRKPAKCDVHEWVKHLATTGAAMLLATLPWFVMAQITYGSILQNSLLMKTLWRSRVLDDASILEQAQYSLGMYSAWLRQAFTGIYPSTLLLLLSFLVGLMAAQRSLKGDHDSISASTAMATTVGSQLSRLAATVGALSVYFLGAGLFYAVRFSFVREWYYGSARILWSVLGILLCALIFVYHRRPGIERLRLPVVVAQGVIVLGMTFAAITYPFSEYGATRGAGQFVTMAEYIKEHLPQDAVVGAYSSGILSYFSERRVVNLDGLANVDILEVASSGQMDRYLDALGVTWLADHESIIWPGLTVGLLRDGNPEYVKRLQEVYRVPCDSEYGDIVLWKVLPAQ